MHIVFGWGKNPGADDMKYRVTSYKLDLTSSFAGSKLANCVPGEIDVDIELPPTANPAQEFLNFAVDQHNTAKEKGCGKIAVYKEMGVGESIQEISFEQGWISSLNANVDEDDDKFSLSFTIVAASVTLSKVTFKHPGRSESFTT